MKTSWTLAAALGLLAACSSPPPAPEWQASAFSALHEFSSAHLSGNTRLAELELSRARQDISRTGRLDLMARAELTRCATLLASLDWAPCTAFDAYALDATAQEQAYARFLTGQWADLNPDLLPTHYRALVLQRQAISAPATPPLAAPTTALLQSINDPLARLIAASVLLKRQQLAPSEWPRATETASAQGWRRPLLAWLGVELKSAQAAGKLQEAEALQRRIDVVLQTHSKPQ